MRSIAILALALLAGPTWAQEGIYVGIGVGNFDYTETSAFLAPDPFDDTVSSWQIYGGFEINDHLAFEIRYGAADEFTQSFSGTDPAAGAVSGTVGMDFRTTSAVALGMLPKDWGALFAGLGYFDQNIAADLAGTTECCGPFSADTSLGDEGLMALLGVEWRFGRFGTGVGFRIEYEWLDVEDASGSTVGIGVAYRF